jgi:hypothetical protein
MQKSVFPDFRFPAQSLPTRVQFITPVPPSSYITVASSLPRTDTRSLKSSSVRPQPRAKAGSVEVEFLEGFIKHLESEAFTQPSMNFLEVKDIENRVFPNFTEWGLQKLDMPRQKFVHKAETKNSIKESESKIFEESEKIEENWENTEEKDLIESPKTR